MTTYALLPGLSPLETFDLTSKLQLTYLDFEKTTAANGYSDN